MHSDTRKVRHVRKGFALISKNLDLDVWEYWRGEGRDKWTQNPADALCLATTEQATRIRKGIPIGMYHSESLVVPMEIIYEVTLPEEIPD